MAQPTPTPPEERRLQLRLRRPDQAAAAAVLVLSLAGLALHWVHQSGHRGRMLEVERQVPGTVSFTVDINEAAWPELTVLPGVGETLAKRIVQSRADQGDFRDLDDLRRVRGIGPRTLERIKPYVRPLPDWEATAERGSPARALP
jgi:competence protein ComEA